MDSAAFPPDGPAGPGFRLIARDLVVDRGGRRVLDGVGLSLSAGEALIITGANGAGKSTLIRAILGLVTRAAGTVRVEGAGIADPEDVGRYCHYLGHRDAMKTSLTVRENLAFWCAFLGGAPDQGTGEGDAVEAALEAVDLADLADLPAGYLSAGQRRRLAIARLQAVKRPIWLLDEPTAALDSASEARLTQLIATHLAVGGAMLAATHLPLAVAGLRQLRLEAVRTEEAGEW